MLLLAASLFFVNPEPLDMPRAEAYLVTDEDGRSRLEDRYDRTDLWTSRAVLGCWSDDDGRVFTLAKLDVAPPAIGAHVTETRVAYTESCVPMKLNRRDPSRRRSAVALLSPFEPAPEACPPRQQPRGMKRVEYWQGTNRSAIVTIRLFT